MIDNEDKHAWCRAGELAEKDFVASNKITGWGVAINPDKHKDPYCHDFIGTIPVDLKSIREPWRCLLYTSPSPRDGLLSRMPSSA